VYSLQLGSSCSAAATHQYLVHVPPFQTLIDEAFTASGSEPVLEPSLAAGGSNDAGGASGAPAGTAGNESAEAGSATGGVGAAAGEAALEPEGTPPASGRSGCSIAGVQSGDAGGLRIVALLALGALARRRNFVGRRRRR
jgi:hypothetical protein